jgi:hypothetical protein
MGSIPIDERDDGLPDSALDRLVDGELSPDEQRRLLEQLETDPNGWRRVGLAFLEAQALRRSCREWRAPAMSAALPVPTTPPMRSQSMSRIVTSAVALLLAFGLGGMTGRNWPQASLPVAKVPAPVEPTVPPAEDADAPVTAVPVAFRYGDGTTSEPVSTPVIESTSPQAQAWLQASQGVPERVREMLRQQGQKLTERQEWVEIQLEDGRRGYMPVQEWVVAPVSLADFR